MKKGFIALVLILSSVSAHAITAAQLKANLLAMTNAQLYQESLKRKTYLGKSWSGVGACVVGIATSCATCACGSYAQTNYAQPTGYNGLPYSDATVGTGCMAWKSTPTVPQCWPTWSSYSPNICSSSVQDNSANQMRIALNMSGDVCKLETYVQSFPTPQGATLSSLPVEFITTNSVVNPRVCAVKRTSPDGIVFRVPLSAKRCNKWFNINSAKNDNAAPPTVSAADAAISLAVGQLTSVQISNTISALTASLNEANQAVIDSKYAILQANIANPTLTTAQVTALNNDISAAQNLLSAAPTQDQIVAAIYVAAGATPSGYVAPVAIAAPTTDYYATVNTQIAAAAATAQQTQAAQQTTQAAQQTTTTTTTTTTNN